MFRPPQENSEPAADRSSIADQLGRRREMQRNESHPTSARIASCRQLEAARLTSLPSAAMVVLGEESYHKKTNPQISQITQIGGYGHLFSDSRHHLVICFSI